MLDARLYAAAANRRERVHEYEAQHVRAPGAQRESDGARRERTVQRASNPSPSSTVAIPSAKRNSPPLHDICAGDSLSASTTTSALCALRVECLRSSDRLPTFLFLFFFSLSDLVDWCNRVQL